MNETIIAILILFAVILTHICKVVYEKLIISIHRPLLEISFQEALQYAKNITGFKNYVLLNDDDKDLFIRYAMGYMILNYKKTMKELNIINDNDKLCSMLISKIDK